MIKDVPTPTSLEGLTAEEKRALLARLVKKKPAVREYPLSFGQERLWFLLKLKPGNTAYNIPLNLELRESLDHGALVGAFQALAQRHAALRTVFRDAADGPVQRVLPSIEPPLYRTDLRALPEERKAEEAARVAERLVSQPFDLRRRPGWLASIAQWSEDRYLVFVLVHHIIFDDWSGTVFLRELRQLYDAFRQGRKPALPPLPLQYGDYVRWQRKRMRGDHLDRLLDYWRSHLGLARPLELPTDRPRPTVQSFRGNQLVRKLDGQVYEGLQAMARRERVTLFMTLLGAYAVLLHRLSGQSSVSVGTPVAGRDRQETGNLIGFLLNMLPMRVDLSGDPAFRDVLQRVRSAVTGAYAHQEIPFEKLVDELAPQRDLSRNPIFQVSFVLLTFQPKDFDMQSSMEDNAHNNSAKFDLTLTMMPVGDELAVVMEYNTDLFDQTTVERWQDQLALLLETVRNDPAVQLSRMPLPEEEAHRLLSEWAPNPGGPVDDVPVHRRIAARAAEAPDAPAVAAPDGSWTYGDLDRRANRLAHWLARQGVRQGDRVAVCLDRSVQLPLAALGAMRAGAAYLPLDPAYPAQRLSFMLEDSGAVVVLSRRELESRLPEGAPPVLFLDEAEEVLADLPQDAPPVDAGVDDLAYVIYTSGSTGRPKGVAVPHGGLLNLVDWHLAEYALGPEDRCTLVAGTGFDASVWETWPVLCAGASLHVPELGVRATPQDLVDWLVAERITVSFLPTPMGEAALAAEWPESFALRALLVGGDRLRIHRPAALDLRLMNHYGPTENSVVATWGEVAAEGEASPLLPSIGRPISGCRTYLLGRRMEPVPQGAVGELYLGGASLARGYLDRPALTAGRFVPDPFSGEEGGRLYRTGDLCRWLPDGTLDFVGRADHQVKVRGFRIELGEIEAALRRQAGVSDAVLATRERSGGDLDLVAYLVPTPGAPALQPGALRKALREELPDYMVPAFFVPLDALPITPNGKLDRNALPAPDEAGLRVETVFVAPRNRLESVLVGVWKELLELDRVGIDDNFFDLGGNSLLLVRAQKQIEGRLEREVPVIELFNQPTVRLLAGYLVGDGDQAGPDGVEPEERLDAGKSRLRRQLAQSRVRTGEDDGPTS